MNSKQPPDGSHPNDDLKFATDSSLGFQRPNRDSDSEGARADIEESVQRTWVPSAGAESPPEQDPSDVTPEVQSDDPDSADPNDTWVPSVSGSGSPEAANTNDQETDVQAANDGEPPAVDRTWAMPAVPTNDHIPSDNDEDSGQDSDSVSTANTADEPDVNKTWVASKTPTLRGSDVPADPVDTDRTWVPSATPTHHDFSFEKSAERQSDDESADLNRTWVPSKTPTVHGQDSEDGGDKSDNPFERTAVVTPSPDGNPSISPDATINLGTRPGAVGDQAERTQIFSRTMGMRGLSEKEYKEWQDDVAARNASDTEVREFPDPTASLGGQGRRTQIWSRTSGSLDTSLIIRSRPVAGDEQFEIAAQDDRPDYQIIEKLAEGGMGAVFIAKQTSLDRELAIKTLKPLRESEKNTYQQQGRMSQVQKQRREMFLSEALVTANLVHPHIIPIHDLCQSADGSPFYSMKRVHGTPWNDRITEMSLEENLEVLHKVCDAVAYAHHNGVVNRDLKPENIMLGEFGEVLVLDWGLAVPASEADKKRFASPSASFGAGTPAYMSPELWTGPPTSIGTWSDIYLLGAILFEVLTGKAPHTFPEPDSSVGNSGLYQIIDKVIRSNSIRPTEVSGELMDIALKAMSTDPRNRHSSVLVFQEAVKKFQKHEESRRLSTRADSTLQDARKHSAKRGYQDYQTAAALFEEARSEWQQNPRAADGLRETRLAYASLAYEKGDYDLGLQIASQEQGPEFAELSTRLTRSRRLRNGLKYGTLAALLMIAVIGTQSYFKGLEIARQNQEITALYGNVSSLKEETTKLEEETAKLENDKLVLAEQSRDLKAAMVVLEEQKAGLVKDQETLIAQASELKSANTRLEATKVKLESDRQKLEADIRVVSEQKDAAEKARVAADLQKQAADRARTVAEAAKASAEMELVALEEKKSRAVAKQRTAEIANLIRNADYVAAQREVQNLINALENDPELAQLPDVERQNRLTELRGRLNQLKLRTIESTSPVQTQVISPSGRSVVWGDSSGLLSVRSLNPQTGEPSPKADAELQLDTSVTQVAMSTDEQQVIAASDRQLHLWNPNDGQHQILGTHSATITALALSDGLLLSADAAGSIRSWDLKQRREQWSIRSSAGIRDLAILPTDRIFLYAGSRGGESADILAYRLPPSASPTERPERLGQLRLPRNRNSPPECLGVSPDERLLLIGNSRDGELMVLRRRPESDFTGRDRFPFQHAADLQDSGDTHWLQSEHKRPVNDIRFSADGRRIVTASDDRTVGVWNVVSADEIQLAQKLEGHGARVNAADFLNSDGTQILSVSADRCSRTWDTVHYEEHRRALEADLERSLNPTVSASEAKQAAPIPDRYLLTRHEAPEPAENSATSGSARTETPADLLENLLLKSNTPETRVQVTDEYHVLNADGQLQRGALQTVLLNDDASWVVTGASDGTAVIWNSRSGLPVTGMSTHSQFDEQTQSFEEGHDFNMARLRFLPPKGHVLLTTGFDGNLCLWDSNPDDPGAGHEERRIPGLGLVNAVATSRDGHLLVTSAGGGEQARSGMAAVWNMDDLLQRTHPEPVALLERFHKAEVSAVAVSRDGQKVATGARDGRVAMWNASSGRLLAGSQVHAKNTIVSHLEWLPDGGLLSAGFDGQMHILQQSPSPKKSTSQADRLKSVHAFEHDRIPVERLAMEITGLRFVTISARTDRATQTTVSELQLWETGQVKPTKTIRPAIVKGQPGRRIASVHWAPDGRRLAAVVDGNLQIFDTGSWKILSVLEAPQVGISDAVFAPFGAHDPNDPDAQDLLATFDGTAAHLWNLKTRSHVADFRPQFAVHTAALSHSEKPLLLTGDRAIRVFQADADSAEFGQTLFKISNPHRGLVSCLMFHPQKGSEQFFSAGADGSATLWDCRPETGEATVLRQLRPAGGRVAAAAWSPDGNSVLLAIEDGQVEIIRPGDEQPKAVRVSIPADGQVELAAAGYSFDGRFFAVGGRIVQSGESAAWIFQTSGHDADPQPELHATVQGHEAGGFRCLSFLPNSPHLVTGGADGTALIWNWQPERAAEDVVAAYLAYQLIQLNSTVAHTAPINAMAVSPNGQIATAADDGRAILWNNPFR
ncbi:MAG: protein kinase [Planctomycetaceae bacterium]